MICMVVEYVREKITKVVNCDDGMVSGTGVLRMMVGMSFSGQRRGRHYLYTFASSPL